MHTYLYRANALFTVASTALAIMCAATALTDWTFPAAPVVDLQVKSVDGLLVPPCLQISCTSMTVVLQLLYSNYVTISGWNLIGCVAAQTDNTQDRAWLTVDMKADLRSLFHWNTKQVMHRSFNIASSHSSYRSQSRDFAEIVISIDKA